MSHLPLPEVTTDDRAGARSVCWFVSACVAVVWGVVGAVALGLASAVGLAAGWLFWGHDALLEAPDPPGFVSAAVGAGIGCGCGLVAGVIAALLRGSAGWSLAGAATGALGGGLAPLLMAATRDSLIPEAGFVLAWAAVGLVAGLIGYAGRRRSHEEDEDGWDEGAPPTRRGWAAIAGPAGRLTPTLVVAGACLVVAFTGEPSPAGWAMLAVGLLGLAVAWALAGQERRIRELERQPRRPGSAPEEESTSAGRR